MITGLPILGDTSFKFPDTRNNNQDSTVSLRCAYNHVFDKVSVSKGISNSHIILARLKFPQGDVNGDATLMLSFQFIQDTGTLEGAFSNLSSLHLKFFSGSFVNATFVDQMASGGVFAQICVQ